MDAHSKDTAVLDYGDPARNMYGCLPCPKCGSEYRAPFGKPGAQISVECDGCGHKELAKNEDGSPAKGMP